MRSITLSLLALTVSLSSLPLAFAQSTASDKCSMPSQRDSTCSGRIATDGSRPTDNATPVLQKITNARAIPGKSLVVPVAGALSPILTVVYTPLPTTPHCKNCMIP